MIGAWTQKAAPARGHLFLLPQLRHYVLAPGNVLACIEIAYVGTQIAYGRGLNTLANKHLLILWHPNLHYYSDKQRCLKIGVYCSAHPTPPPFLKQHWKLYRVAWGQGYAGTARSRTAMGLCYKALSPFLPAVKCYWESAGSNNSARLWQYCYAHCCSIVMCIHVVLAIMWRLQ